MSAARGIAAVGNITPNESTAFVIFDRERRGDRIIVVAPFGVAETIMKSMYPAEPSQAERALEAFVGREPKPPYATTERQPTRPRPAIETDDFGR